ncbi:hypothetical protein [Aurantiacibacter marinus]|uniref:Uncharacterized protein n=1 Tax=Aurantiacibacter marinus TaxID=874156 RepID=A0A0H0XNG9_9SPHN|nr:hypothetical protein [Aurantiacibacter marinus]KLI64168.1 hypothetical protein AAV99_00350 [Aurantiacibacter marinus]
MTSRTNDLSGEWDGEFSYPAGSGPVTPFLANLNQRGTSFTGFIMEPDIHLAGNAAEATIVGVIAGDAVDFTKTYRKATRGYENPVDYVGQLLDRGERITGVWSLLHMNGTFEMTRRGGAEAEEEREAEIVVER